MEYQGGQASMVIVLPDEVEGLRSVLQKLASGHNIMTDIEDMRSTELDIVIPKFKVETTIDLKKMLPKVSFKFIYFPVYLRIPHTLILISSTPQKTN